MKEYNINQKCEEIIRIFRNEISKIRTGRANTALVEGILVDVYDTRFPISHIASVSTPDANSIVIVPWDKDKKVLDSIVVAIQKSDLGINPILDGDCIRLNIPPITEERRKELVKLVDKYAENTRVGIRNIRRNAISELERRKKEEKLPDDYANNLEREIENTIKKYLQDVDEILSRKKNELLGIVN